MSDYHKVFSALSIDQTFSHYVTRPDGSLQKDAMKNKHGDIVPTKSVTVYGTMNRKQLIVPDVRGRLCAITMITGAEKESLEKLDLFQRFVREGVIKIENASAMEVAGMSDNTQLAQEQIAKNEEQREGRDLTQSHNGLDAMSTLEQDIYTGSGGDKESRVEVSVDKINTLQPGLYDDDNKGQVREDIERIENDIEEAKANKKSSRRSNK
jgi:hypothetical protein